MASNRQCLACKTGYSYCPSCSRVDKLAPAWKAQFCSEDCMTLWMTLTRYNMDRLSKSEAKEIISSLNLKPIDVYVDCVKRDYNKVFEPEKKFKRGKRIEIKPIDEFSDIEQPVEVVEPVVQEPAHEVIFKNNKEL